MSFSRSPITNARRREELADGRRTAAVIGVILALAAFSYVAYLAFLVRT